MEDTNIKAATSCSESKRPRRRKLSRTDDRFSNLPDNVYDLIFSFLAVPDATNLSLCSKRFRELYYSANCLTIDKCRKADSYTRFLINRGYRKVSHLRVSWALCSSDRFGLDINTWIRYAVRCDVEYLNLQLTGITYTSYRLPLSLFSCRTLRHMTIDMDGGTFEFPSATACIHLQSLVLKGIGIDGKKQCSFTNFLSSFCNLKDLRIENIRSMESMEVKSSSLESFCFLNLNVETEYDLRNLSISGDRLQTLRLNCKCFKGKGSLEIYAPNLKDFEWKGRIAHSWCFQGFKLLNVAKILLTHNRINSQKLYEVVRSLSWSKHLHLCISVVKNLFEHGYLPIALDITEILLLHINKRLNYGRVLAIGHFLKGAPNLKNLHIKSSANFVNKNVHGADVQFWESQNLVFVNQLEMVEIDLMNGITELKLARFLLKHAKMLKKMVIFHPSTLPENVIQEANELKKASSDRVYFQEIRY